MIKDMWNDLWIAVFSRHSTLLDRFVAATVLMLTLALLGGLALFAFDLVDTVGIDRGRTVITVVEDKHVSPAGIIYLHTGKVLVPMRRKESYRIGFKIDSVDIYTKVNKELFDHIEVGDKIEVDCGYGRLSRSAHIIQIRSMI